MRRRKLYVLQVGVGGDAVGLNPAYLSKDLLFSDHAPEQYHSGTP